MEPSLVVEPVVMVTRNQQFVLTLVGMLLAALPAVFAFLKSREVQKEVKEVHTIVNSRTDELQRKLDQALAVIAQTDSIKVTEHLALQDAMLKAIHKRLDDMLGVPKNALKESGT